MDPCVQGLEPTLKVRLVILPRHAIYARGGFAFERIERQSERIDVDMVEERGEPLFLPTLAACRTRSSACDTRARVCVRCVLCRPAFPLVPGLGSTASAAGEPALFGDFTATMPVSDFS